MKVAILAGGLGTRLREETEFKPKPMVEIGGRPILWHIMKTYAHHGYKEFVICLGYKGNVIRDYFLNYRYRNSDITLTLGEPEVEIHNDHSECGWKVTLAETGDTTLTGGRLRRIARYVEGDAFMATYGDGVANVDIARLIETHRRSGKLATMTAVRPASRFGELSLASGVVNRFEEKPQMHDSWINGGYFVFHPKVLNMIGGDEDRLESTLLPELTLRRELAVYQHEGFWQCMDTMREVDLLNTMWRNGEAPWAVWDRTRQPAAAAA